jgi:hypothetical protein
MPIMAATEGQALADAKADEIARLSWNELDAYGERTEQSTAPSGRVFRVSSRAYWDMEPWASGIEISVKAITRLPACTRRVAACYGSSCGTRLEREPGQRDARRRAR